MTEIDNNNNNRPSN